jgi:hypothetical protein
MGGGVVDQCAAAWSARNQMLLLHEIERPALCPEAHAKLARQITLIGNKPGTSTAPLQCARPVLSRIEDRGAWSRMSAMPWRRRATTPQARWLIFAIKSIATGPLLHTSLVNGHHRADRCRSRDRRIYSVERSGQDRKDGRLWQSKRALEVERLPLDLPFRRACADRHAADTCNRMNERNYKQQRM